MAGESYTSPVTGETYTVPSYTDPADAPIAFKDFADTITGGGGIDIPATRVDAVVQTLDGSTWSEGMALSVVAAVPADTEGQVGDVVFVSGKSPAPSGAAKLSAITGTGTTHVDGDFVVYEFIDNGTVTVSEHGFIPEALIVGGGGAGGGTNGGGGGAGGTSLNTIESIYLTATSHPVTVGAGGLGVYNRYGTNGGQSSIGPIIGIGGGAGMGGPYGGSGGGTGGLPGMDGGCGGGAKGEPTTGNEALGGSPSQAGGGFAGGANFVAAGYPTGGGGGLGAVGVDATSGNSGAGGAPLSVNITGTAVDYGGGGGGGGNTASPGPGGGAGAGAGSNSGNGASASIANRGSGGGGGGNVTTGGDGASGVVIIRIPAASVVGIDKSGWTEVSTVERQIAETKRVAKQTAALKKAAVKEAAKEATTTDIEETE